jgi:hypothetical protein
MQLCAACWHFRRLQREFGPYYAVLPAWNVRAFQTRVQEVSGKRVLIRAVSYSDDLSLQSPVCKRMQYAYQREVRFLIGESPDHETEALKIHAPSGFRDLIDKNVDVRMRDEFGRCMIDIHGVGPIRSDFDE